MKFLIVSHVDHKLHDGRVYAYGPYVREMNLWFRYVDEVRVVAPLRTALPDAIDLAYEHDALEMIPVPAFNLLGWKNRFLTLVKLPLITLRIARGMIWADHIHLRCPGNMGLLGALVQMAFPHKPKTAKYAGNWDPDSPQPWSYRLQKKILSNSFLTRNMKVLVYGEWPNQTKNIVPFFTASYHASEAKESEGSLVFGRCFLAEGKGSLVFGRWFLVESEEPSVSNTETNHQPPKTKDQRPKTKNQKPETKDQKPIHLLFVGKLSEGKRPLLSVQAAERLHREGIAVRLDLYGEGEERPKLESYIAEHGLGAIVSLHGNQDAETLKDAYRQGDFLVFASRSEGWPKVVAEAMWWGCLPITTRVSCVDYMIGYGSRGQIVEPNVNDITKKIKYYLKNREKMDRDRKEATEWARQFTLETFENEIGKLLYE